MTTARRGPSSGPGAWLSPRGIGGVKGGCEISSLGDKNNVRSAAKIKIPGRMRLSSGKVTKTAEVPAKPLCRHTPESSGCEGLEPGRGAGEGQKLRQGHSAIAQERLGPEGAGSERWLLVLENQPEGRAGQGAA